MSKILVVDNDRFILKTVKDLLTEGGIRCLRPKMGFQRWTPFACWSSPRISPHNCPWEKAEPGRYVKISIRDTGTGMDAGTLERGFDSFFTTKPAGQGVRLDPAAAYGIIQNHGGIMDVISEHGKGSTFTVHLPASKHAATGEGGKDPDQGGPL